MYQEVTKKSISCYLQKIDDPKYLPVYDPKRMQMKVNYHKKEIEKLGQLGSAVT